MRFALRPGFKRIPVKEMEYIPLPAEEEPEPVDLRDERDRHYP